MDTLSLDATPPGTTPPGTTSLGGKADRLLELQRAGFRVPAFVVSPDDVRAAVTQLGYPLVVRSSATVEDGEEQSFAGQFRSYLNLRSIDEVQQAIEQCRLSMHDPALLDYCRHHGIDANSIQMFVIVQRMVEADLSGVAFTVNPANGQERVVIEACAGLSDGLLSGRENAIPEDDPFLTPYRGEIERTARAIQRHYGAPQDIEFAISRGTLYVLQARPITRINFPPQIGSWTNADFRDGGVSSSVCSPLMWSLYELAWDAALKQTLRQLRLGDSDFVAARLFFGRPYWNLAAVKQRVAELPGFVERNFDDDLSVRANYEGDGQRTPVTFGRVLRALPTVLAIGKFFRQVETVDRDFLGGGFQKLARVYELKGDNYQNCDNCEKAFESLIHDAFFITECRYFRTIFAASLAKLDLLTTFPQANDQSLLASLPPLRHMDPLRCVQEMAHRDANELDRVVSQYRHHYRRGLDVCLPRWDEDREFVTRMLRDLPPTTPAVRTDRYALAVEKAEAATPRWRRRSLRRKLERLRNFVWLREEMRDLSSRMYYLVRRYALEIGRRRGLGESVFFMRFQDILADDRSRIQQRREVYESFRNFKAPNEIGGPVRKGGAGPLNGWQGLAAGAGWVHATAFVARSVEEAIEMPGGQILVCPFTDPGWTPVLHRAAGCRDRNGRLAVACRSHLPRVWDSGRFRSRRGNGTNPAWPGNRRGRGSGNRASVNVKEQ